MIATAVCYPEVALRRATPADRELVYAWNSAAEVRALSNDPRPIAPADHARWYAQRIALGGAPIWIIVEGAAPVGVVGREPRPGGAAARAGARAAP
ncbi:MAG: GNAT family N-acetyltransferase, partial [Kofleriaceae bacterium]